jgi:hypothetical protein
MNMAPQGEVNPLTAALRNQFNTNDLTVIIQQGSTYVKWATLTQQFTTPPGLWECYQRWLAGGKWDFPPEKLVFTPPSPLTDPPPSY